MEGTQFVHLTPLLEDPPVLQSVCTSIEDFHVARILIFLNLLENYRLLDIVNFDEILHREYVTA